jgi:hypothetical protein
MIAGPPIHHDQRAHIILWTLAWSEYSHNGPTRNLYMQKYDEARGIKGTAGFSHDLGDRVYPIQLMNGISMIVVGKTPVIAWTSAGDKQYMNVIAELGEIRCSSMTQSFVFDQRHVQLKANGITKNGSEFTLSMPVNKNIAPPGYYYMFLVSASGTPSLGHIIQLT